MNRDDVFDDQFVQQPNRNPSIWVTVNLSRDTIQQGPASLPLTTALTITNFNIQLSTYI